MLRTCFVAFSQATERLAGRMKERFCGFCAAFSLHLCLTLVKLAVKCLPDCSFSPEKSVFYSRKEKQIT